MARSQCSCGRGQLPVGHLDQRCEWPPARVADDV